MLIKFVMSTIILASLSASAQSQTCSPPKEIARLMFQRFFDHSVKPNDATLNRWACMLYNGQTVREVVRIFAKQPSYKEWLEQHGWSAETKIDHLYIDVLGRTQREVDRDRENRNGWASQLRGGRNWDEIVDEFVNGIEYDKKFGDWIVPNLNRRLKFCPGRFPMPPSVCSKLIRPHRTRIDCDNGTTPQGWVIISRRHSSRCDRNSPFTRNEITMLDLSSVGEDSVWVCRCTPLIPTPWRWEEFNPRHIRHSESCRPSTDPRGNTDACAREILIQRVR